jgi:hypothetical protein
MGNITHAIANVQKVGSARSTERRISGNSNDVQYDKHNENRAHIEYTDKLTYADIEIRNTNSRKDFINNNMNQPIQCQKPIPNRDPW